MPCNHPSPQLPSLPGGGLPHAVQSPFTTATFTSWRRSPSCRAITLHHSYLHFLEEVSLMPCNHPSPQLPSLPGGGLPHAVQSPFTTATFTSWRRSPSCRAITLHHSHLHFLEEVSLMPCNHPSPQPPSLPGGGLPHAVQSPFTTATFTSWRRSPSCRAITLHHSYLHFLEEVSLMPCNHPSPQPPSLPGGGLPHAVQSPFLPLTASLAQWLRRLPRERYIRGSIHLLRCVESCQ